jgi:hypothetical protein
MEDGLMIICFQCSLETKEALDQLVNSGHYNDYGEAISLAINNLAVLQNQISKEGILFIEEENTIVSVGKPRIADEIYPVKEDNKKEDKNREIKNEKMIIPEESWEDLPEVFRFIDDEYAPKEFAKLPADSWLKGQVIPLDLWFFGQFNKLLPAKASCRALAFMLIDNPSGVELPDAAESIANNAVTLGDYLTKLDEKWDINREDAISTAFPKTGANSNKSKLRYANQFVASINKQGQITGLLASMKLINLTLEKNNRVTLTKPGWEFSHLKNPVLDESQPAEVKKFSELEIEFLLRHISKNVPKEDFAYRTILGLIDEGINTPTQIDDALKKRIPLSVGRNLSQSFLSAQRSGTISRMTDLCLVDRERDGINMSYKITSSGKDYLNNNSGWGSRIREIIK